MNANKTYSFMIRCKCEGKLGASRVEVCINDNRDGYEFFSSVRSYTCFETRCWSCRAVFKCAEIQGRKSLKHECGAKCRASKGPNCECSCAGKNHGRSYA